MELIKKNIDILSLAFSAVAIVLATLSFIESRGIEERTRKLEIYDRVKTITEKLNLEFSSGSLYFTTLKKCPDETAEEKTARLSGAAIEIGSLEVLAREEDESLILFLKSALLMQQGDYEEIDRLLLESDSEYIPFLKDMRFKYEICIPREEEA